MLLALLLFIPQTVSAATDMKDALVVVFNYYPNDNDFEGCCAQEAEVYYVDEFEKGATYADLMERAISDCEDEDIIYHHDELGFQSWVAEDWTKAELSQEIKGGTLLELTPVYDKALVYLETTYYDEDTNIENDYYMEIVSKDTKLSAIVDKYEAELKAIEEGELWEKEFTSWDYSYDLSMTAGQMKFGDNLEAVATYDSYNLEVNYVYLDGEEVIDTEAYITVDAGTTIKEAYDAAYNSDMEKTGSYDWCYYDWYEDEVPLYDEVNLKTTYLSRAAMQYEDKTPVFVDKYFLTESWGDTFVPGDPNCYVGVDDAVFYYVDGTPAISRKDGKVTVDNAFKDNLYEELYNVAEIPEGLEFQGYRDDNITCVEVEGFSPGLSFDILEMYDKALVSYSGWDDSIDDFTVESKFVNLKNGEAKYTLPELGYGGYWEINVPGKALEIQYWFEAPNYYADGGETITINTPYIGLSSFGGVWNPFRDVPAGQYYTDAVLWAVEKGITNGMTPTTFAPEGNCTRGQVVTFLWRAHGCPSVENTKNPFRDVPKGEYYTDAVLWAVEEGITNGTSATTFSPNATVTRGEFVTFLWRAEKEPKASVKNPFVDVPAGQYYTDAVLWALENKITTGTSATTFGPSQTCIRRDVVTFLYRALE